MILTENNKRRPKNAITISHAPTYIDKSNPPLKRDPFKTILQHPICHTLDLVLPQEQDKQSLAQIIETHGKLHWCKAYMKLIDIISGDFFDTYIKTGDILMLSEGRAGLDNCYTLQAGILRLEIDKATFESLGLEGKAIPDHGRKHVKSRYAVELNLREPSMVRGKKGFGRVVWAFENVLTQSVTWLFVNLKEISSFEGPIADHSPIIRSITPEIEMLDDVQKPSMSIDTFDEEDLLELQEWSSLAMLDSPRIRSNDKIDSYLSRYQLRAIESSSIYRLHWHGLVYPAFVIPLLVAMLKSSTWLVITGHAFDGTSYTIIKTKDKIISFNYQD